ncbi:MAG: BlaI/MecI/CopY family transcriptional regulator [Acidobacteria bacterium]|nr:BlaI/MecI/CopY family transcriptional regulator [Acidobacteriota bacterium]MBV9477668.1 BlaI/MecI/CopY family transcriptional regulator [Acidobacteriota bacterium]
MKAASKVRPALSGLELEVMNLMWDLGEATSAELVDAFTRRRPLAATTIRTVLAKIEEKGYVERVPTTERALRYRASIPREAVSTQTLRQLVGRLFGGSPKAAIAQLLADEELDADELAEIQRMVSKRRKELGR